jgi:tetratricopeptide (TPR) repeat protein
MLGDQPNAIAEYERAVTSLRGLAERNPGETGYRHSLALAYNWLGETLRAAPDSGQAAEAAYRQAMELQKALLAVDPDNATFIQDLARTHYNSGILHASHARPGEPAFGEAEADFREAIRLLEPLATPQADARPSQDFGRALNNLATLLAQDDARLAEARALYEQAIALHEDIAGRDPQNRQYKLELAKFSNNLSDLLRLTGQPDGAAARNARALELLAELARPAPSLGIELADTHSLRGHILQATSPSTALAEYRRALAAFDELARSFRVVSQPDYHRRFTDLLLNIGSLAGERPALTDAAALLTEAVRVYVALGERALAEQMSGPARMVVDNLSSTAASLNPRQAAEITALYRELEQRLRDPAAGAS